MEYFEGRTDFMTFRSVALTTDKTVAGGRPNFTLPGAGLASELFVTKMVVVFDRNPAIAANNDIAKRVYAVTEGKLTSQYHFVQGKITCLTKVLQHTKVGVTGNAVDDEVNEDDLDALQEAVTLERETFGSVKANFAQMQIILKYRSDIESQIAHELNIFEVALNKLELKEKNTDDTDSISKGTDNMGSDYLTPFLRNLKDISKILD